MATDSNTLPLQIPMKDGTTVPIYMKWKFTMRDPYETGVPEDVEMTFFEFALDPRTSAKAAQVVAQAVKDQTKYSPLELATGFLYQTAQGASLGWAEELSTSLTAIPYMLKRGYSDPDVTPYEHYTTERDRQRLKMRTQADLFQYVNPNISALGRGTGMAVPIALSMGRSTPTSLGQVGRAVNPFALTTSMGLPTTLAESITKSVMISMINTAGNEEGYLKDRLKDMPAAMRHGLEWGVIGNLVLFGTLGAINQVSRIPRLADKMEFIMGEAPAVALAKAGGDVTSFRKAALSAIARAGELDLTDLTRGIVPAWLRGPDWERFQAAKRGTGDVTGQQPFTLGELGGPHVQSLQRQALRDEPTSAGQVFDKLDERLGLEGERISTALRDTQPGLPQSVDESLLTREARTVGTREGVPIDVETAPKLDAAGNPIPLGLQSRLPDGVAGVYYTRGYDTPELALAGTKTTPGFMKMFKDWDGWESIYNTARELRDMRIGNGRAEAYTAEGLSNKLPEWDDFLGGIRYIPKSTFREHGFMVKEQLNPDTGIWQPYKSKPFSRGGVPWETRETLHANSFERIREHFNPNTNKWVEVGSGRKPHAGWATRFVESGNDFVVRLKDKSVSMETLHDMRKSIDPNIAKADKQGNTAYSRELKLFRKQFDDRIKANPDMAKADAFFSTLRKMQNAASRGSTALTEHMERMSREYNKLGINEQRMFRAAFIEEVEKGVQAGTLNAEKLMQGSFPQRLQTFYPSTPAGSSMYARALSDLEASAQMSVRQKQFGKIREDILALDVEPKSGWMQTLKLLAKIPAYKFSSEFALGRDLIEKARNIDMASKRAVNAEINDILNRFSGPEAAAALEELASHVARTKGDVPTANMLKEAARLTLPLPGAALGQAGTTAPPELPTTDVPILADPEGEGLVPLNSLLDDPEATYPLTEGVIPAAGTAASWAGRQIKKPWDLMYRGLIH